MDSPLSEPLLAVRKTVIGELQKGKEYAIKLQALLRMPPEDRGGHASAEELTLQVSKSFTESLSILNSCGVNGTGTCQIVATNGAFRVSSGDRSSKSSDPSRKRVGVKDRRGCYKRRNASQSRIIDSPTTEDGYAWRKYGQKEILNNKFPRCYFRCTHKFDQECKATKQVQRIKDDPPMYRTTYFGHHTCQDTLMMRAPQIILDSDYPVESYLLSFDQTIDIPTKQYPHFPNNFGMMLTPTANDDHQELKDVGTQSDASDDKSCLDSSVLQDQETLGSPSGGARREEVVSSMNSCSSTPLHGDPDMEPFNTKFGDLDNHDLYLNDMEFFQGLH